MPKQVVLKFPVELPEEGVLDKKALKKGKEAVVLELLREGKISQGKAAELLEIDRHSLFDLMAKHDIPVIDMTEEELKEELSKAEKRGIVCFGSLKVLKDAKDKGLIEKIKPIGDELRRTGLRIKDSLYQKFLQEIGE